jgi:4-hydroxyacetophenone monooxygenase
MMVPRFPNFFILYGPNSQPASGGVSLPSWFQIWAAYVARCLQTMFDGGFDRVAVTEKAFEEYNARLDAEASKLAFLQDTRSIERNYSVDSEGRLLVNTPFETAELYAMMKAPNRGDLEFA